MTQIINSIRDLERCVSEWVGRDFEERFYPEDIYKLAAYDLSRLAHEKYGFRYGEEFPEITNEEFWDIVNSYTLEVEDGMD